MQYEIMGVNNSAAPCAGDAICSDQTNGTVVSADPAGDPLVEAISKIYGRGFVWRSFRAFARIFGMVLHERWRCRGAPAHLDAPSVGKNSSGVV